MLNDHAYLSIDFLAGMTIFMIAFIWVATMIPGLLISLQGGTIDYDAVAYRTGVILVEDPGWPSNPPWEIKDDLQKDDIERFGLSIEKDTPNILKLSKVERFFCSTSFHYPDDYQHRVIFGDRPYLFNISLSTFDATMSHSVGDIRPDGYGYIRRLVKIKYPSNSTINAPNFRNSGLSANVTKHVFSVQLNCTELIRNITNLANQIPAYQIPAYQINPLRDRIMVNISNMRGAGVFHPGANNGINLSAIEIFRQNPAQPFGKVREYLGPDPMVSVYIDGGTTTVPALPASVTDNVSVIFSPGFFYGMASDNTQLYINYTYKLEQADNFFNNSFTIPYPYDYNHVTRPILKEGVLEVAIW
ncbi:MAG: hypothetical protein NTY71_00570 [Methanoregula sp.]|jgi:hypothetical protein|nr:hypothetical protein [Methanoregula sp.]